MHKRWIERLIEMLTCTGLCAGIIYCWLVQRPVIGEKYFKIEIELNTWDSLTLEVSFSFFFFSFPTIRLFVQCLEIFASSPCQCPLSIADFLFFVLSLLKSRLNNSPKLGLKLYNFTWCWCSLIKVSFKISVIGIWVCNVNCFCFKEYLNLCANASIIYLEFCNRESSNVSWY